jgi:hypothetical protein
VRPEFWSDANMAALPAAVRLTYIGLWGLADDAGYLVWNVPEIAAELYRYTSVRRRETAVAAHLDSLLQAGRVELLPCGRHALIRTIPEHRIKGGHQSYVIKKSHDAHCSPSLNVGERASTSSPQSVGERSSPSRIRPRSRRSLSPQRSTGDERLVSRLSAAGDRR